MSKNTTKRVKGVYTDDDMKRLSIYGLTHADVDGKSTTDRVQCTCPFCGNKQWIPEIRHLLENKIYGCSECSESRRGKAKRKVYTEEEYAYLAKYNITREMLDGKSVYDHVEATCPYCGNTWNPTPFDLLSSQNVGCSKCKYERMWNTRRGNANKNSTENKVTIE